MIKQPRRPRRDRDPNGAVGADKFQSLSPPERQLRKGEISPGACFLVTVEHVHIHTVPTIRFNDGLALT